jgi:hypothetical protein
MKIHVFILFALLIPALQAVDPVAPDSESKRAGKTIAQWAFTPVRQPVFVACRYALTAIMLARPMPKDVRACTVTYNPGQTVA